MMSIEAALTERAIDTQIKLNNIVHQAGFVIAKCACEEQGLDCFIFSMQLSRLNPEGEQWDMDVAYVISQNGEGSLSGTLGAYFVLLDSYKEVVAPKTMAWMKEKLYRLITKLKEENL